MIDDISPLINVALFALIIGAAVVYLASQSRRVTQQETADLAQTRGEKNSDLEKQLEAMSDRVTKQDGQIELILGRKFDKVINRLDTKIEAMPSGANWGEMVDTLNDIRDLLKEDH